MAEDEKNDLPTSSSGDRLHAMVRGLLGVVPYAGGLAAEIFGVLVVSPYQRKLQRWIETVADQLRTLEDRHVIDFASLATNDVFVSTLLQATQAAVRTHREEKISLLRSAVLASASDSPVSADQQSTFVRYVDELTPPHFGLLGFICENEVELCSSESYRDLYDKFTHSTGVCLTPDEFRLLCSDLDVRLLVRFSRSMEDSTAAYIPGTLLLRPRREDQPMLRVTDIGRNLVAFVGASHSPNLGHEADG